MFSFFFRCAKNVNPASFYDTFLQDADDGLKILRDEQGNSNWSSIFKLEFFEDYLRCIRQAFGIFPVLCQKVPQYENLLYDIKRLLQKLLCLNNQGPTLKELCIRLMRLSVQILGNACIYDCNKKLIWDLFIDVFM